jgi:hypothetical protein
MTYLEEHELEPKHLVDLLGDLDWHVRHSAYSALSALGKTCDLVAIIHVLKHSLNCISRARSIDRYTQPIANIDAASNCQYLSRWGVINKCLRAPQTA